MALTELQTRFCAEYLRDLNARAAAERAGYSPSFAQKAAAREIKKPELHAELTRLRAERTNRTQISIDEVVRRLLRLADRSEAEGELNTSVRALELLGKHLAMFTDKLDSTVRNPFTSGSDPESMARDLARLLRVIGAAPETVPTLSPDADPEGGSPPSLSAEEGQIEPESNLVPIGAPKPIPFTIEPA